ncbi:MAG: HAMP domain-containing protein [Chloroflexi bacterium]|nr:HAMP domain-containing protein [Chloroflexota bacterium]
MTRMIRSGRLTQVKRATQDIVHRAGLLPRLLAAEALLFVLLFAGGFLLIEQLTDSLKAGIRHQWYLLGNVTALSVDTILEHGIARLELSAAGYRTALAQGNSLEAQAALDLVGERSPLFTGGVAAVDRNRRVVAANRSHARLVGNDLQASWPESTPPAGPSRLLTWGFRQGARGDERIAIAIPLDQTDAAAYLVGLIDPRRTEPRQVLRGAVQLGYSGHADLVDGQCLTLLTTLPGEFLRPGDHPTSCRQRLQDGLPEVSEAVPEEAENPVLRGPHLMAFIPLKALPWAIEMGTSMPEAYAPAAQLQSGSLALLAMLTGLALAATVFVGRKIVDPVKALSAAARQVAEGRPRAGIGTPWGGEIGELANSLEVMRSRLQGWAGELEEQVQKRTEELEQRNRELRGLYETLRREEAQRRDLLGKVLTAQEDERRRVSRELHDGIGQALWALAIDLERLAARPDRMAGLQRELENLHQLAVDSLSDLRQLIVALRPSALDDLGLVPAIRRYAELYLRDAGIEFEIQGENLERRLDLPLETVVYRVVQEAINNVARHSGASRARIEFQFTDSTLIATVRDDGRGFEVEGLAEKPGVGLQGMEERASLVGGKLLVESQPGRGTLVRVEVPLTATGERDGQENGARRR